MNNTSAMAEIDIVLLYEINSQRHTEVQPGPNINNRATFS